MPDQGCRVCVQNSETSWSVSSVSPLPSPLIAALEVMRMARERLHGKGMPGAMVTHFCQHAR